MEGPSTKVRTGARETIQHVFRDDEQAIQRFLQLTSTYERDFRPLNLNGCRSNVDTLLTLANSSESHPTHWNENYSAYAFSSFTNNSQSKDKYFPVLHLQSHLVGYLDSDPDGSLRLLSSCWTHRPQIIIAPPPKPNFRKCPIWCRDWRYIPPRNGSEGIFEVLRNDVVLLRQRDTGHRPMTPDSEKKENGIVQQVSGTVRSKSCIIASRSRSPCFFIELVFSLDETETAVIIVFHGRDATCWWPFIEVDSFISVTILKISILPRHHDRHVLRVSGSQSQVLEGSFVNSGPIPFFKLSTVKRIRLDESLASTERKTIKKPSNENKNAQLITYEGEVTQVDKDGRFELDGKLVVYLGSQHDESMGHVVSSLCLRKGTRIQVHSVFPVSQFTGQILLLSTARTVVHILFFGPLKYKKDIPPHRMWNDTPWRSIWKHCSLSKIGWADELFNSLFGKFSSWLCDTDDVKENRLRISKHDKQVTEFFLGSKRSTGLVFYLMSLINERHFFINFAESPTRDMFTEFLSVTKQRLGAHGQRRVVIPELIQIVKCAEACWTERMQKLYYNFNASYGSTPTVVPELSFLLSPSEILSVICRMNDDKGRGRRIKRDQFQLGLMGRLQSNQNLSTILLADSTGEIEFRIIGNLKPHLLGSIVVTTQFYITVYMQTSQQSPKVMGIVDVSTLSIVLDGEYNSFGRKLINHECTQEHNLGQTPTARMSSYVATLSQGIQRNDFDKPSNNIDSTSKLFADVPVFVMFIYDVISNGRRIKVTGRVIAFKSQRIDPAWQSLESRNGGFWKCSLIISGDAGMEIAPVLRKGELIGISCTELHECKNIRRYFFQKIQKCTREQKPIHFFTHLKSLLPWIENLGQGTYMRFMTSTNLMENMINNEYDSGFNSSVSDEGELYMHISKALESFREEIQNGSTKKIWELFEYSETNCIDEFEIIRFEGTIISVEESVESNIGESEYEMQTYKVMARENILNLFTIPIYFYGEKNHPDGLVTGLNVVFDNVRKVRQETKVPFVFVGNGETDIHVLSVTETTSEQKKCECSVLSTTNSLNVIRTLPRKLIWSFFQCFDESELGQVGWIRIEWIEAITLRVSILHHIEGCMNCQSGIDDSKYSTIHMEMEAKINDGTCDATLHCDGLYNCKRLLGMNEVEMKTIRNVIQNCGSLEIGMNKNWIDNEILQKMMKKRHEKSLIIIVINETSYNDNLIVDNIEMKNISLGYGEKFWTGFTSDLKVKLKCVGVIEERNEWEDNDAISIENVIWSSILLEEMIKTKV